MEIEVVIDWTVCRNKNFRYLYRPCLTHNVICVKRQKPAVLW